MERNQLHEYQNKAVEFIKDTQKCALWVDMGLGKTVTTLTAVSDMLNSFDIGRVLVIAPKRVAEHTWPKEIKSWGHTKGMSFKVMSGVPGLKRQNIALNDQSDIHIINRENVGWLVETICFQHHTLNNRGRKDLSKWPYDMVVIDESSSFKAPNAKRFKALKKVISRISRMVQLTGTPASNGLLDLWPQMFLLDQGERLGKTFTKYKTTFFDSDYFGYTFTPKADAEQKIYDKLSDICLTMSAKDYIELPERIDNIIPVNFGQKIRKTYSEFEKEFLLEIEDETIEAVTAATLTNKLLQFCNGAVYLDDQGTFEEIHTAKLNALEEIIETAAGQPVLVAYNFKSDAKRIKGKFPKAEMLTDSDDAIDRWNAGEIPILLAHPASAGHGLNLQKGGNIVVWFGLNWSLELYQQFNARLHRQGQEKTVVIHHLAIENSVDQTVLQALENKDTTQKALLDALKSDIHGRLAA